MTFLKSYEDLVDTLCTAYYWYNLGYREYGWHLLEVVAYSIPTETKRDRSVKETKASEEGET